MKLLNLAIISFSLVSAHLFASEFCLSIYKGGVHGTTGHYGTYCTAEFEYFKVKERGIFSSESSRTRAQQAVTTKLADEDFELLTRFGDHWNLVFTKGLPKPDVLRLCMLRTRSQGVRGLQQVITCDGGFTAKFRDQQGEPKLQEFMNERGYRVLHDFGQLAEHSVVHKTQTRFIYKD